MTFLYCSPFGGRLPKVRTTALKSTYEGGWRDGDSIARRVNFLQKIIVCRVRDGHLRALQRSIEKQPKLYQLRPDLTVTSDRTQSYLAVGFKRGEEVHKTFLAL